MLRCGNLPAEAAAVNAGQCGGAVAPPAGTGSECVQSNSAMPGGLITMNRTAPVIKPPTCAQ